MKYIMGFLSIVILSMILYCFIVGNSSTRKFMVITMVGISILAAVYRIIKSISILKFSGNIEEITKAKYALINIVKATIMLIIVVPIIWIYVI